MTNRVWASAVLGCAVALAACEDGTGPGTLAGPRDGTVTLAVVQPAAAAVSGLVAEPVIIGDSAGAVVDLQTAQVVLKEVELKREDHDACEEEDDACEKFEVGFQLVDLPLAGGVVTPFATPIDPGVYDELELKVRRPGDDAGAADFLAANPDWPAGASLRLVGTFDAGDGTGPQAFDVFVDVSAEIERDLEPPLVVDSATAPGSVNVTVAIDVDRWLRAADGSLIDPRALAADEALRERVRDNVEASFEAFEDRDRDGRHEDEPGDDRGGDDDGGTDDGGQGGDDGPGHT